ncbi:outer membrane protein assembly factor BamA [Ruegeria hyattellae]|uniref:outer membrane protein assembly factor BamA n=1 Tax=Ruegeria hyattellae TaxID=3233337 RepID=UPI00355B68EB
MKTGTGTGTSCGGARGSGNMLWRALAAIFFLTTTAFVTLPDMAAAQTYVFNSVQVEGNERIETSTIITRTGIERGKEVSAGQLNDAVQRVLDSGVFETVEMIPRGSTLIVKVAEYPTINQISFEGNKRIKNEVLTEVVSSESRRVYTPEQAERDAVAISDVYSARGRIAATVVPRIIRRNDNRVDLVFEIAEGETIEVERISFVGNRNYSDRRLRRVLETKQAGLLRTFIQADTFIADRIEFDKQVLRDFYLSRGYVDFRVNSSNVEFTRERDAFFLVLNVTEGQQFSFGQVTVSSEIAGVDPAPYLEAIKVRPGVIYSPSLVDNEIARLEKLGLRNGVDFLRVEPRITRNDRDLSLDIDFALVRGPRIFVERIDIEGNTTTLDRVIRNQFRTVEGDPFNPREIRESAERIRALGFFANSDVETREGSTPDRVIVDVDVEEQPTGSLNLGGNYSAADGFGLAIGLTENNFLGRGQSVSLNLSTAQESERYTFSFSEPNLLGRDLRGDLDLGYAARDSSFSNYDTRRVFFTPGVTFPIGELSSMQLRYDWGQSEMRNRGSQPVGAVIASEIAEGKRTASGLGVSYVYDSRRSGLDPTAGVLFRADVDAAGLGGDDKFVKAKVTSTAQRLVLSEEVTLKATVELGAFHWLGDGNSRTIDRFLLGPRTFRGFEPAGIGPRDLSNNVDDAIGGNYYAVARLEADFPLGLPEEYGIRGGLFYDLGNLWNIDDVNTTGASIVGGSGSLRQVVGFSVLWTTPFGPLRFNFSKALQKEDFDKEQSFDVTLQARF